MNYSGEDYNFHEQVNNALENNIKKSEDYNFRGVLYAEGSLSNSRQYFYFVSINQEKVVTTNGKDILHSDIEPFASNRGIIEDEEINSLISLIEAVKIAKPILNCYKDYPKNMRREVYLHIDGKTDEAIWIVTVEDAIQSTPGPNVSHFVKLNAFTEDVLDYD